MADLKTTASFDDSQVDAGLARMNRKFKATGEGIEKSTEGARKFAGALSSTAGIVTGVLGVVGLVAGVIGGIVSLVSSWRQEQERVSKAVEEHKKAIAEIQRDTDQLGQKQALYAAEEQQALERIAELKKSLVRPAGFFASERFVGDEEFSAINAEITALLGFVEKLRRLREQAHLDEQRNIRQRAMENEKKARDEQLAIQKRMEMEREAAEAAARQEQERLQRLEREADALRRQVEIDNLRARGLNDQADALERQRELQRTIRSIEEAEGLTPDERRELIEKARDTAKAEEAAARARAAAAQADPTPIDAGRQLSTFGLAAGVGAGNALLQSQVFGAGRTTAEQQQLAEAKKQSSLQQQIAEAIDRLLSEPRLVA